MKIIHNCIIIVAMIIEDIEEIVEMFVVDQKKEYKHLENDLQVIMASGNVVNLVNTEVITIARTEIDTAMEIIIGETKEEADPQFKNENMQIKKSLKTDKAQLECRVQIEEL